MATFNPNELIIERVRSVEQYDIETNELTGRYTQIEDPTLEFTADSTDVTDAMQNVIYTIYRAQSGTFGWSNSLFSLDLAAAQFGSEKELASDSNVIYVPVSETLTISDSYSITLSNTPYTEAGATYAVPSVKLLNDDNTLGDTWTAGARADATAKTYIIAGSVITFPTDVTGRVFVDYTVAKTADAAKITKTTDSLPTTVKLIANVIFKDTCNTNTVITGKIVMYRAQQDISNVSINLTSDGKHSASFALKKNYCDDDTALVDVIVSK